MTFVGLRKTNIFLLVHATAAVQAPNKIETGSSDVVRLAYPFLQGFRRLVKQAQLIIYTHIII